VAEHEIGVVGLATMGENLARNLASHGARVAVYNRTRKRTDDFMAAHGGEGDFRSAGSLEELAQILKPPRAILLMVKAGSAVDDAIDSLKKINRPNFGLTYEPVNWMDHPKGYGPNVIKSVAPWIFNVYSQNQKVLDARTPVGAAQPVGEARPGWKVLRVLGTLLNLSGFEYQSSEDVREELRKLCTDSAAVGSASAGSSATAYKGSFRVEQPSAGADVLDLSMYHIDALVRRAPSLQKTREGRTLAVTY